MEQHNPKLTYGNDCPHIYFLWQGRIYISNTVLRLIGNPSGIRLLWNVAKRALIIQPTDISDPNGYPVIGKRYILRNSLLIGSTTLINEIWSVMTEWDKTLRYRIVAKYNKPSNVAIFELKYAEGSDL